MIEKLVNLKVIVY